MMKMFFYNLLDLWMLQSKLGTLIIFERSPASASSSTMFNSLLPTNEARYLQVVHCTCVREATLWHFKLYMCGSVKNAASYLKETQSL